MTDNLITNHDFVPGRDGRCCTSYGVGPDRERCGNAREHHAYDAADPDRVAGAQVTGPAAFAWAESVREREAMQVDGNDPLKTHEATKRVLYHVVAAYQYWRASKFVPNELLDSDVGIGERHLRLVDWFPLDEGWFADGDATPTEGKRLPDPVLTLIDEELGRLRSTAYDHIRSRNRRQRAWDEGAATAREVAAGRLQEIREAYVAEQAVRESEVKRTYGINS